VPRQEHHIVRVTDIPPTEIECVCGKVFNDGSGSELVQQMSEHMKEEKEKGNA
jgi:hypothetical protein